MSSIRLFVDFGSTFTKVAALDLEREELAARTQAPSTVDSDVAFGLREALRQMSEIIPIGDTEIRGAVASSSAAGGLRMLCIGMVPEYTTEAGRLASLGAGAKVIGAYSYELSPTELSEIERLRPDIILLTGGTDGGNRRVITHNARALASAGVPAGHVIVAGNKSAGGEISEIFKGFGNVRYTENVMPELGRINFEPVGKQIREIFLEHIIHAKGIAQVDRIISGVLMPTPSAVLEAAKLIALGIPGEMNGLGELMLIDVGGATTDVYSIAAGYPMQEGTVMAGLPEPFEKRTVEGDLGLYHNLDVLVDIMRKNSVDSVDEAIRAQLRAARSVPSGALHSHYQTELTRLAIKTAVDRHAGMLETLVTSGGTLRRQKGKDLTGLKYVIGAGGPVSFSPDPRRALEGAVGLEGDVILKPVSPEFLIDSKYILFAVGLLSLTEPRKALRIVKKYLKLV